MKAVALHTWAGTRYYPVTIVFDFVDRDALASLQRRSAMPRLPTASKGPRPRRRWWER